MIIKRSDLQQSLIQQIKLLDEISSRHGCQISYCKCHGALYHDVCTRSDTFSLVQEILRNELPFLEGHITMSANKENKPKRNSRVTRRLC